jgi:hypothetical protein
MRNKTVVSVLIIAVALALPAKGSHVDRNEIRENPKTFKAEPGGTCSRKGRRCSFWARSQGVENRGGGQIAPSDSSKNG